MHSLISKLKCLRHNIFISFLEKGFWYNCVFGNFFYFLCTFALERGLELRVKKGWGFFGIVIHFGTCCFRGTDFSYAMKPRIG